MRLAAVAGLEAAIRGVVLLPDHPEFDTTATVVQLARPARPALIVRPADAVDVARVIAFARDEGLEIAVRGGGHSAAAHGTGDGVLVIDMRDLRELAVDPVARRLRAGAGLLAGDVVAGAHEHGLTVPLGDSGSVGVAGITLGGGFGYLSRQHGLTVDHLVSADLVTADGRLVTASPESEPELFWAIRGGGGNFGVVTSLVFNMVEAGSVYGGALVLPATENVLRGIAPLAGAAPRELGVIANLRPAPPAPFVPPEMVGRPVVVVAGVYNGDAASGVAAWAPFRALATPVADALGPMPYPAVYRLAEGAGAPSAAVSRSMFVEVLDDTVVDALRHAYETAPGTRAMVQVRVLGGAINDQPGDATAYAHRAAPVHVMALAAAPSAEALGPCQAWADDLLDSLRGRSIGAYVNFLEVEGEARIREAYPARTHRRLAATKAVWDPDNVFRRNQNIRPAG
jgi:FAD/FMN-containing dehydrogenase